MCDAIEIAGFPGSELTVLGPRSPLPLSADLVVETTYAQGVLGSSFIANNAPGIVAAFGTGPAGIQIRLVAPDGAAAYQRALTADFAASKTLAGTLLGMQGNGQITVLPVAHAQMVSGQADIRAVYTLMYLATAKPLEIIDFGNIGASSGLQLRYVDVAEDYAPTHMSAGTYLAWMRTALKTAPYHAQWISTLLSGGIKVIRIDFGAPTPLGLK